MKVFAFFILSVLFVSACSHKPKYSELQKQNELLITQVDSLKKACFKISMENILNATYSKKVIDVRDKKIDSLELIIDQLNN